MLTSVGQAVLVLACQGPWLTLENTSHTPPKRIFDTSI
jgi:hypothetical protein